jgi:hypothetical protein
LQTHQFLQSAVHNITVTLRPAHHRRALISIVSPEFLGVPGIGGARNFLVSPEFVLISIVSPEFSGVPGILRVPGILAIKYAHDPAVIVFRFHFSAYRT